MRFWEFYMTKCVDRVVLCLMDLTMNWLLLRSPTCCFSKRCCVTRMGSVSTTPTAWMDVDYSKSRQSGCPSTTSSAKSPTPTTNITGYRWKSGSLNQWNSCMNLVLSFFFNLSLRLLALIVRKTTQKDYIIHVYTRTPLIL